MKNRTTKRSNATTPEKATGRVGPFPYHRAGNTMQEERQLQSEYQEEQRKKEAAKEHLPLP